MSRFVSEVDATLINLILFGMALTPKQEAFCREYLIDLNATQAAIRAGYSENTARAIGCENLTKPDIQEYVQSLMNERAARTQITADYVLGSIHEIVERCKQAVPVVIEGEETGEYRFEAGAALKGCELLGKHLKLFTDKHEHTGKDGQPIESTIKVEFVNNPDTK